MPNYRGNVKIGGGGKTEFRWVKAGHVNDAKKILENIYGKGSVLSMSSGGTPPKDAQFVG